MVMLSNNSGENKYEYTKILLTESKSKYIYIPMSVIANDKLDIKRVSVFSYLKVHCGINDVIGFTVSDMVEWCNMKPNKRADKINDKFLSIINDLCNSGYLTYINEPSRSSYMKCKFNTEYYYQECSNGYAVIYLDELEKIMSHQSSVTNTTILLVFAYLRNKIQRRPNELKPEERNYDSIIKRRERYPEAYNDNISNIAKVTGVSDKTISKTIDILEKELNLIVTDRAYRIKNENNEFRTLPTIFANAYKREDRYLLATGYEYSRAEIELKAKNMKQYKIDKRKRIN